MSEQFGAVIEISTGVSERNVDNLVKALNGAAKALFSVEDVIKKYSKTSDVLSASLKNVNRDFSGLVDSNGKLLSSLSSILFQLP